ncbi:MAG TPA: hypothetical protein VMW69_06830 [Spirochaetia bacterium]|nr:hypothetical protein [Spirochaetia bacterium]
MAYTPELDREVSGFLRRIVWAENHPMTSTLMSIVWYVAFDAGSKWGCAACRDRSRCTLYVFQVDRSKTISQLEMVELLSEV